MSKLLTTLLAAVFAVATVSPVFAAEEKKEPKKEMKKGEGKKTDGKKKAEEKKTDGKKKAEEKK